MTQAPLENPHIDPSEPKTGLLAWWHRTPLYLRILGGAILGAVAGMLLHEKAAVLEIPSQLILRILGALAPPLIFFAVLNAIRGANIEKRVAGRLAFLLILNTTVAILIGLAVANIVRPGRWSHLEPDSVDQQADSEKLAPKKKASEALIENIPKSLLMPLVENNVIGVILVALAFGIAMRRLNHPGVDTVGHFITVGFECIIIVLHWVIDLVPIGVFGIVARIIGTQGFGPFKALAAFILAVLLALFLQLIYYLVRIRLGSWVRPIFLLRAMSDALVMAFSTDSSTATMPVTYAALRDKVGLRQESASLGALIGTNFNNDGTALYEAMSALFIAQMTGWELGLGKQVIVILTSIVASVGAAGIPEAGLVTMTLVFGAVGLPLKYIAILLTVDWFLDRSRTMLNVMGDVNVSCLLDGQIRKQDAGQAKLAQTVTGPA